MCVVTQPTERMAGYDWVPKKKNRLCAVAPTFIIIIISNPDYFTIPRLGKGGKGLR